ncbi:13754_t:CDS:2, partial [Dentiscutata heterogama]
ANTTTPTLVATSIAITSTFTEKNIQNTTNIILTDTSNISSLDKTLPIDTNKHFYN